MRQAYDYWQDQPGNYPTGNPRVNQGEPLGPAILSRDAAILYPQSALAIRSAGRPRRNRASFGPVRSAENHSIFATSLHYSTLVSFGHTSATTKSTECPEHTSGKNAAASSESQCLFLAKGHHVQHPSVLSWPLGPFFYTAVISCSLKASKLARSLAQHRRLLPNMPQLRTREHFTEQGLLIRTKYSSIAFSVFPDACPHAITRNRLFPSASLSTSILKKFKRLTKSPH